MIEAFVLHAMLLAKFSELLRVSTRGVFVHDIHDPDPELFHTHPWDGVSFIFGEYEEELFGEAPKRRRFVNFVSAHHPHRVTLPKGRVWSLFIHGPRKNRWSVRRREGMVTDVEPWRGTEGRKSYAKEAA